MIVFALGFFFLFHDTSFAKEGHDIDCGDVTAVDAKYGKYIKKGEYIDLGFYNAATGCICIKPSKGHSKLTSYSCPYASMTDGGTKKGHQKIKKETCFDFRGAFTRWLIRVQKKGVIVTRVHGSGGGCGFKKLHMKK
jgi:hypothetical protein